MDVRLQPIHFSLYRRCGGVTIYVLVNGHILNFVVGPTLIKVKFEDILLNEMKFFLNDPNYYQYVVPSIEFQHLLNWKPVRESLENLDSAFILVGCIWN